MGSHLDAAQVLPAAFDDASQSLKISVIAGGGAGGSTVVAQVLVAGTSINIASGAKVKIVSTLASAVSSILVFDTTGYYLQLFTGPSGATLLCTLGPGQDTPIPIAITSGLDVWIRSAEGTAITQGQISLTFLS